MSVKSDSVEMDSSSTAAWRVLFKWRTNHSQY